MKKSLLTAAALSLAVSAYAGGSDKPSSSGEVAKGECHGVNSCKGKGECGGKGHACAGQNSCKGKGWVKMSKDDCEAKGGKFKS